MKRSFRLLAALLTVGMAAAAPRAPIAVADGLLRDFGGVASIRPGRFRQPDETTTRPDGLRLRFRRSSEKDKYAGLVIRLKKPLNLTGKALQFTVRGDNPPDGLYLRLYNAQSSKPVWSHVSWRQPIGRTPATLQVCQGPVAAMTWEAGVVETRDADAVDRIEMIVGAQQDGSFDADFSNFQIVAPKPRVTALTQAAPLPSATVLVADGKPHATILHPDTEAGRRIARAVSDGIRRQTGVALPCRPGTAADRLPEGRTILLGNLYSNPAMRTLYARGLTLADEIFPGPAGWIVEGIVEPFRRGSDIWQLAASDEEGLQAAADEFLKLTAPAAKPGELRLPYTFRSHYAPPYANSPAADKDHVEKGLAEARRRLAAGQHTSLGGYLNQIGLNYRRWHRPADARLYVEVAKLYAASAQADPRKFGGAWGFDSDFPSFGAIGGWDAVEHDPSLTDADRLAVTSMLARWLTEAIVAEAAGGLNGTGVVSNHLTFASLGTLMGALYFQKYYGDQLEEPARWLAIVRHNFARQNDSPKAHDDCNGYQWLTWHHVLLHALAMPDDTYFQSGTAEQVLRSMLLTMDNLGIQVPYGDTGSWKCWTSESNVLNLHYAATRDPLAAWILRQKRQWTDSRSPGNFYGNLPEVPAPDGFTGVKVLPLAEKYYRSAAGRPAIPPRERCFDKLSFREALAPDAFYLLTDGVNNGGHKHADAAAVLRHTQFNRIWLADNDYFKSQQKFHNTLMLLVNGRAFPLPNLVELVDRGENDRFGWCSIRIAGLGPAVWTRHLIWLKPEQAYLVWDRVRSSEPAELQLKQRWHGVGELTRLPDGARFVQQGPAMRFQGTADSSYEYADDFELGKNWVGYPYAAPVVRVLDQIRSVRLAAGETAAVAGVWHGDLRGADTPWRLTADAKQISVDTGTRLCRIEVNADDRLRMREDASAGIPPTTADASAAPPEASRPTVPELPLRWQYRRPSAPYFPTAHPDRFRFRMTGTEPAPHNLFLPDAPNRLEALLDGRRAHGDEAVMFAPGRPATIVFDFDEPIPLSGLRLHIWQAERTSIGRKFRLDRMKVRVDCREAAQWRAADAPAPDGNFGRPTRIDLAFPEAAARRVEVELIPPDGAILYPAELALSGPPPAGLNRPELFDGVTRLIRAGGRLYAGTAGGTLLALDDNGGVIWEKQLSSAINDLTVVDLDGDGRPEIPVALQEGKLLVLDDNGGERFRREFEFYRVHPAPTIVRTADLDGDGRPELLVGCDNWRTYALKADGKELWNFEVIHPTRAVTASDLDGDGRPEVLCGTKYYSMSVLSADGKRRWTQHFGPGCRAIRTPRNGDGVNVVAGSDDGNVYFFSADSRLLSKLVTGDEVRTLALAPVRNGRQQVFAGSFNGHVYCLAPDGKPVWYRAVPGGVTALCALPDGGVAAGTDRGAVVRLNAQGEITGEVRLIGAISDLALDKSGMFVATTHGEIVKVGVD